MKIKWKKGLKEKDCQYGIWLKIRKAILRVRNVNIKRPDVVCPATEYIKEQIELIKLMRKWFLLIP